MEHPTLERPNDSIEECKRFNKKVYNYIVKDDDINLVVIGSRFFVLGSLSDSEVIKAADLFLKKVRGLQKEAGRIIRVKLFPPPLTPPYDVSKCVDKSIIFGYSISNCKFNADNLSNLSIKQQMFVKELKKNGMDIYPVNDALCPGGKCSVMEDGIRIFRDDGHLRNEGSLYLALKQIGNRP